MIGVKHKLATEITKYMRKHKLSPSGFGVEFNRDPTFVHRVMDPTKDMQASTIDRCRAWMTLNKNL